MTGPVLLVLGAVLGIFGVKALGRNRTAFPEPLEGAPLIQHGAYGFVRHPLYSSVVLLSFGWALVWGSVVALAISVISAVFFDTKVRREERWLAERFSEYADYRRRVRRLIPWVY